MKICVTGTRGIPNVMGGVETHCEELFPRIVGFGHDVTVIRRSDYVSDGKKEWKGVKLIDIKSPRQKWSEALIHTFRAVNAAKALGAEIIHIHAIGPGLLVPYARLRGLKVVFTHHGPDYDRDKWGYFAKTMLRLGERLACKYSNQIIVISDVIRKIVTDKYGVDDRTNLIYNGVGKADFCDLPDYFESLGIEKGKYILGMSRFVPEKRLDDIIKAYSRLKADGKIDKDTKLVLAGDTDFEDEYSIGLKQLAHDNSVVLTGFIKGEKLHSILTGALCYVLPSSHEGLPIALLEAMSYRLPVVVSDIPANKEVGLPEECYFSCGNIEELANKLNLIINQSNHERVGYDMSSYDWDNIARQVDAVYLRSNNE